MSECYYENSFPLGPPAMLLLVVVVVTASIFKHFLYATHFSSFNSHYKSMRWAVNVPRLHSSTWLGPGSELSRVALEPLGDTGRGREGITAGEIAWAKARRPACVWGWEGGGFAFRAVPWSSGTWRFWAGESSMRSEVLKVFLCPFPTLSLPLQPRLLLARGCTCYVHVVPRCACGSSPFFLLWVFVFALLLPQPPDGHSSSKSWFGLCFL